MNINMKIAVTHKDNEIFQNFVALSEVKIYTVEDDKIIGSEVLDASEYKGTALTGFLVLNDVDVLICGGIDGVLLASLLSVGIKTYPGVKGNCDTEAEKYINGEMNFMPNASCHHEH